LCKTWKALSILVDEENSSYFKYNILQTYCLVKQINRNIKGFTKVINKFPTIWFTGLSASGKTTLSSQLLNDLKNLDIENVVLLDGESLRDAMKNYKFDSNSREAIALQKAKIASDLNDKGQIVLVSGISHKKELRNNIRNMIDNYYEVFLECEVAICASRDYKDGYRKAFAGEYDNFIGVTEQYQRSSNVDLTINTGKYSIKSCSSLLLDNVKKLLNL